MSKPPNEFEMRDVFALPPVERYHYLLEHVVEEDELWTLRDGREDVWIGDQAGARLFPVWPHAKYAEQWAKAFCPSARPVAISLDEWLGKWTQKIHNQGALIALFPLPGGAGTPYEAYEFADDLEQELDAYLGSDGDE